MVIDSTKYIFVIDTNLYSGNFEREMCAYLTGRVGECGVGEKEQRLFEKEVPEYSYSEEYIEDRQDEHGVYRPVSIWPTPGFWNDGLGDHYPDSMWGDPKTLETYKEKIKRDELQHLNLTVPERYPAYQSVAIFLLEKPPKELLTLWRKRIKEYVKNDISDERLKILKIRLIKEETKHTNHLTWDK